MLTTFAGLADAHKVQLTKKKVTVCKNKKSGGISIGRAAILFHSAYVGDSFFVSFKPRFPYANCKHLGIDIRCVE